MGHSLAELYADLDAWEAELEAWRAMKAAQGANMPPAEYEALRAAWLATRGMVPEEPLDLEVEA